MVSKIVGPFWQAEVNIVELADPVANLALRALFVENVLSAGQVRRQSTTLLMVADVQKVTVEQIKKGGGTYTWTRKSTAPSPKPANYEQLRGLLRSGDLALLLVECNDARQAAATRQYTCLAGEISLDRLRPQTNARGRLFQALGLVEVDAGQRSGAARLPGALAIHGSGLSIYGRFTLPWQAAPLAAPLQLTARLPGPGAILSIEQERLTAAEQQALVQAWQALGVCINPGNPLFGLPDPPPAAPHWVTLEIANPGEVPHFYWAWDPTAGAAPVLYFEGDQFKLLLSDQQPYNQSCPPTSLARVALDDVSLSRQGNDLIVSTRSEAVASGTAPSTAPVGLRYTYAHAAGTDTEGLEIANMKLAYDPIETPQFLRSRQGLPEPEWLGAAPEKPAAPIEPALLWGFAPLADGWAQLPTPNLTEQIYLDAELEQFEQAPAEPASALLQGALALGNNDRFPHPIEQPWNMTLTGGQKATGRWVLAPEAAPETAGEFRLTSVVLEITAPRLVVNGLFWLSTGRPTAADALPDLEDWISSLQSISLRTVDPSRDLFPPLVTMMASPLTLSLRTETSGVSAVLRTWSLTHRLEDSLLQKMVKKGVLPADAFSRRRPWLWRRHPRLPMVQALPLTQSQKPPNYPSFSRQLVPFEVAGDAALVLGVPGHNGAAAWPVLLSQSAPAGDWQSLVDLPLVALSLPGLVLDPGLPEPGLGVEAASQLPAQYRFDLPYTDEINALAQLPEVVADPAKVSPLPDSPRPEPPPPLTAETFGEHWARLSEQASLAAADAVEAFAQQAGQKRIRGLVEPFDWPVQPTLDLESYPGALTLADGSGSLALSGEDALRGISGRFFAAGTGNQIALAAGTAANPFLIEAGSMAAHRGEDGAYRDQRGLWRGASLLAASSGLLRTPVRLQQKDAAQTVAYDLTSALAPLALLLGDPDNGQWQIWFRDLPVRTKDGTFDRSGVLSGQAQDINDPEALSREHDYLAGYEWRLGAEAGGPPPETGALAPLPLFGLHFYPLTLEKVVLDERGVQRVEIVGRLQLPLPEPRELEDFSNAVRLTFQSDPGKTQVRLQAIALQSAVGEWPLALDRGEDNGAPRLVWNQVTLADGQIRVGGVLLRFFLFGLEWTHPLGTLVFPQTGGSLTYPFPDMAAPGIYPQELELSLPSDAACCLTLMLSVVLGKQEANAPAPRFRAAVRYDLLTADAGAATVATAALMGDLQLAAGQTPTIPPSERAMQFSFRLSQAGGVQLLPGMALRPDQEAPGFAALTFTATATPGGMPTLRLASAFVEALLFCRWNDALQDIGSASPTETRLFDSSSGDLVFGYTTQLRVGAWEESLLLNGVLEIKNLISWPVAWTRPDATPPARLTLPLLPQDGRLSHTRHTIRILFNQHQVPGEDLVTSPSRALLFALHPDRSWQFLAVIEHQLVDVDPAPGWQSFGLANDRRWTVLQEVRLAGPRRLRRFLEDHANRSATAPILGDGGFPIALDYGYLSDDVRASMVQALNTLPETMLFVEASAPHWIDGQPLDRAQTTNLQFLPNGSQHGILSRPEDYAPTDPTDPRWLLLPMPFLGRLQDANRDDPPPSGAVSALQVDPILLLSRRGAAVPSLAWPLSHWRKDTSVPGQVLVSSFDTALGRTWARLDPTSLQENWFRLQNPIAEPQLATIQSVMAALPNTPARLSRATALRRAFDAFRPFYPPATPDKLELLAVGGTSDLIWRRNSLLLQQGVRMFEGTGTPGQNQIANGSFNPPPTTAHPLKNDPTWGWQVGDDKVPNKWQVFEFAFEGRLYRGQSSTGWSPSPISLDATRPPPAGRRDWGLPRMRPPNPDEKKPGAPLPEGASWLFYTDAQTPFWIKVGQDVRLTPGRYRFSMWLFPAQETSGVPPLDPQHSQVVLFAGANKTRVLNAQDLPFARWSRAELEFQVSTTGTLRVGVELHGPGSLLRNGWYLNDAELVRLPDLPDGWHITATQMRGIRPDTAAGPQRHAAATLLPAQPTIAGQENPRPLSLAVSPYLGLEFRPAGATSTLQLAAVELLCLDQAAGLLRPAASRFWEAKEGALPDAEIQTWAQETAVRLCPDSPIAVLRYREIHNGGDAAAAGPAALLTTAYRFVVVPDARAAGVLARRVFRLRTEAGQLRFREGQFGGGEMPAEILPFEVAPPQVIGAQPLYLPQRPAAATAGSWPWGLSALRLSVQYTPGKQGVVGRLAEPPNGAPPGKSLTLWWQALQHLVQYRTSSAAKRPAWGLPALYRARAIKSLLPVLPAPPLPALDLSQDGLQAWQPVLPGALRSLISGARAGVLFAVRSQLLRQSSLQAGHKGETGQGLVSGSVPVQQRMPRPVPLPPNQDQATALQPWASALEPERNLLASASPVDEAFFAACGRWPARRLRLKLLEPARGALAPDWNGKLTFETQIDGLVPFLEYLTSFQAEITDGQQTLALQQEPGPGEPGRVHLALPDARAATKFLEGKAAGQVLTVYAHVGLQYTVAGQQDPAAGFLQTLSFPLRFVDLTRPSLPLLPYFLHFEDPEYNRRLSSSAVSAAGNVHESVGGKEVLHTVTLAADRREYNAASRMALRYDWDDDRTTGLAVVAFQRLSAQGVAYDLTVQGPAAGQVGAWNPATLLQLSLPDLWQAGQAVAWQPGDALQVKLAISGAEPIFLAAPIVQQPVIPAPEAAYALLRWQHGGAQVECVRFAWQPNASRIDLLCPEDLRTGVVRRRAVFQWRDSVRPGTLSGYALQKIAANGATHFPGPAAVET